MIGSQKSKTYRRLIDGWSWPCETVAIRFFLLRPTCEIEISIEPQSFLSPLTYPMAPILIENFEKESHYLWETLLFVLFIVAEFPSILDNFSSISVPSLLVSRLTIR